MRSTELGPEYEELAHQLVDVFDGTSDGLFLYAALQPGVISTSLFRDEGERVIFREPPDEMYELLLSIWEKLDDDDRWHNIRCSILKGRFTARFVFPDEIDPKEHVIERRPRVLKEFFGDKPVVYPQF